MNTKEIQEARDRENITWIYAEMEREEKLCAEYVKLNPANRGRAEHERDLILYGLMLAEYAIKCR